MRSRTDSSGKGARLHEQGPPSVETFELPEAVSESDLAVAEAILARLLVGRWLAARGAISARKGDGPIKSGYPPGIDLTCPPSHASVSRDGRDVRPRRKAPGAA